jgi:MFS transporter, SP family, general alpha glucoside:H+ symporter
VEEAEKALNRLSSGEVDNKLVLAMMVETDRLEFEMETGSTYWDVFPKVNIRRTEIAVAVYTTQVFSGIYMVGYAAYFFSRKYLTSRLAELLITFSQLPVSVLIMPSI